MEDKDFRELQRVVKENNEILKKLQSRARWSSFVSFLKYFVYIAIIFGTYYYSKPYIESLQNAVSGIQDTTSKVQNVTNNINSSEIIDLLDQLKN